MLKFLKDIKIELVNQIYEDEYWSSKKISKLDGYLSNSDFSQLYKNIILLKEIVNNNKIENIHTTYYDLISFYPNKNNVSDDSLKTFYNIEALKAGKEYIHKNEYIDKKILVDIQKIIRNTSEGIRKTVGTVIKSHGNKIIYEPPQGFSTILDYLDDLEKFINDDSYSSDFKNLKPLSKLAIIHYQFESIHPFNDGNGRTGRILNILYLMLKKEIDNPIMSLSFYIFKNKNDYYSLLNKTNQDSKYLNDFIKFILKGISESSEKGIKMIDDLKNIFNEIYKKLNNAKIKKNQLLILYNYLTFSFDQFKKTLNISENTARKYLKEMIENNQLEIINKNSKHKKYI
ncbi:MAG: Fic family protein, partial [Malacoplasma sp.]|nr:Fic family protein [Malacoplasma sp.]